MIVMFEGKYRIKFASTGCFHYQAWLEDDGQRIGFGTSGCSIAPHWFDWNRRACEREARRACKKLMRQQERKALNEPEVKTVTFDGRPSYSDLQARIANLEAELQIGDAA